MDGPSNILNNMDNTSNVPSTSFGAPLEGYNSSSWGLNTPSIPFTKMLQGIGTCNSLIQESPSGAFQDSQEHKRS
ncbi:uncharacterized protein [Medicago truncatula]|uniref:uncharacterized protein n=1 Tax=Medicago truncatula TaxID=3880 RepID=UPI001968042E|nr:uncharacterized protein LOC112416338 [Medicago truncatula]